MTAVKYSEVHRQSKRSILEPLFHLRHEGGQNVVSFNLARPAQAVLSDVRTRLVGHEMHLGMMSVTA